MRFKTNERRRKIFFTQHLDFPRITFSSATDLQLISNELIALRPWVVREAEVRGEGEIGVNKKRGAPASATAYLWWRERYIFPLKMPSWRREVEQHWPTTCIFMQCRLILKFVKKIQFWQMLNKLSWNGLVQPMFATTLVKPNSTVRRWKKKFPPSHPPPPPHSQPQQPTLSGLLIGTHCSSFFFGPLPFHPTHICSGRGGRNLLRFPAYKPRRNSSKVAKCVLYSFHDLLGKTKTRLFLLFIKIPTSPQFPFFTLTQLHNFFPYDTRAPWKREKRSTTPKVFLLGSIQVGFPFWHQPSKASLLYTYVWRSVATHPSKKVSSEPAFPNTEGGGRKKEESFGVRCGSPPSSSSSSSYTLGAPHSLSHPKLHMGGGGGERRESEGRSCCFD